MSNLTPVSWLWLSTTALYLIFRFWYDGLRRPLSAQEVEDFMARSAPAPGSPGKSHTDPAVLRTFLESDDGCEFVMCNWVKLHPQSMPHPTSGKPTPPMELLQAYIKPFLKVLFMHGGHPVLAARKVAGYVDSWNTPPDPGWVLLGMMRYRSRRDMMKLATHPRFLGGHAFKFAAIEATFSFPTQVVSSLVLGPRWSVALALALTAALVQLSFFSH